MKAYRPSAAEVAGMPFRADKIRPGTVPGHEIRRAWIFAAAALTVFTLVLVAVFWHAVAAAVTVWYESRTFNHCFLIIPISAYLIWERREVFSTVPPRPLLPALLLAPLFGLAYIVAYAAGIFAAQQLAFMGLLQTAFLVVLGRQAWRSLAMPLVYLVFLVPLGDHFVPALQSFTASFSVAALRLAGVPVFSDGLLISIPGGDFYVAEACAGMRFIIATMAFAVLFCDFVYRSWYRRAIFIAIALVAPVVANGFRAFGIVYLAYQTENAVAVSVDHVLYGWIFFSMVTGLLVVIGLSFGDGGPARASLQPTRRPARGTVAATVAATLVLIAAAGAPRAYAAYIEASVPTGPLDMPALPAAAAPWREHEAGGWKPTFPAADVELRKGFSHSGGAAEIYVAFYRSQDQRRKLVGAQNNLAPGDWRIVARSSRLISFDGESVQAAVARVASGSASRLVYSWYWIDGQYTASPVHAKLLQAKAMLLDRRLDGAFIAISADASDSQAAAATLEDLAAKLGPMEPVLRRLAGVPRS